jgi:acetate kinase
MKILVLNCGSSSLKFQLIETVGERVLAHGRVERIGEQDAGIQFAAAGGSEKRETRRVEDHSAAIASAFDFLKEEAKVTGGLEEIAGVGHRIVHGGDRFTASVLITAGVLREIESVSRLAPLHNPHNLKGYYASRSLLPEARQVAVFDTAFHHTLPARAFLYGLPYEYYQREKLRRYGFHGTSHRFVSGRYAQIRGRGNDRIITCHLGNGCSICAVAEGKSIDTSMGFTPMEGLLMGTRSGDLDPGAVLYLLDRAGDGSREVGEVLNGKSGLAGVSGLSPDMRDVLDSAAKGNERAQIAIDLFCYRVIKYAGAYHAALDGATALVFAGGIGENSPEIRQRVCRGLRAIGVTIDETRNQNTRGEEARISVPDSFIDVWVIPTNEELLIAQDTAGLIEAGG